MYQITSMFIDKKQSLHRSGQGLRVPRGEAPRIHDSLNMKVAISQRYARTALNPQEIFLTLNSARS